jgi:hypothetical protein
LHLEPFLYTSCFFVFHYTPPELEVWTFFGKRQSAATGG